MQLHLCDCLRLRCELFQYVLLRAVNILGIIIQIRCLVCSSTRDSGFLLCILGCTTTAKCNAALSWALLRCYGSRLQLRFLLLLLIMYLLVLRKLIHLFGLFSGHGFNRCTHGASRTLLNLGLNFLHSQY